jgi:hypothetical protein
LLVAADRTAHEDVVHRTDTEQIVQVHHQGILGDTVPHGEVAGAFPVGIGQAALGASAIGVHYDAMLSATGQVIGHHLAERTREQAFVQPRYGGMHVILGGGYPALFVTALVFHAGAQAKVR